MLNENQMQMVLDDPAATHTAAVALGRLTLPGCCFALIGPLGVGKTTFAQGLLSGLGVAEPITSPTFALVQRYAGRCPVYHLDLYRLDQQTDFRELGLEDWLRDDTVVVFEWADRLSSGGWLPADHLVIELAYRQDLSAGRRLTARSGGCGHNRLLDRWAAALDGDGQRC